MKLRLQPNSVRLRLSEAEVAQLAQSGRLSERVSFPGTDGGTLVYEILVDAEVVEIAASFTHGCITVKVPKASAEDWSRSGDVTLSSGRAGNGDYAFIAIIEKDLARRRPERN